MADTIGNIYYSNVSSRVSRPRQRSNSDDQNIIPHLFAPLPCESHFQSYLPPGENPQNISVQFMHSCTAQLDSDILQRHLPFDHSASSATTVGYPESSQRTTSHSLSLYVPDASDFTDYAPCDLATIGTPQTFRRGSWPSHSQTEYSPWIPSPPRIVRSPVSEPPESTSDESYQDSDVEEVTKMSPMMNQFQIHPPRNVDLPSRQRYRSQALQPSLVTFQLAESVFQRPDNPEEGHILRSPADMSMMGDDESGFAQSSSPSSTFSPQSSISFGSARLQGPGMRFQHDSEKGTQTSQIRVPAPTSSSIPFPSPHSPANHRPGDQRSSGGKQQKKSKMHQCPQCPKMFPRPSGLATHMNTHSGAKPYKCIVPNCGKSFAVRSNAKRHLRTHGINPTSPDILSGPHFTVGFEEPMVTQVHDAGRQPSRYRWIPHNPSPHEHAWPRQDTSPSVTVGVSRTAITLQASMSSTTTTSSLSTGSDDDYDELGSSRSQNYTNVDGAYPMYGEHELPNDV